jgi:regulatory protein
MPEENLYNIALSKAMNLCSGREYCRSDIEAKLISWGLGSSDTDRALTTLVKENFINELRYAEAFTRDKFRYNKWGRIKIRAHLKAKKIPDSIINTAISLLDRSEYRKCIADLLHTHRRSVKAKNNYELKGKLLRFGLSRGFESEILYDLLNDLDD